MSSAASDVYKRQGKVRAVDGEVIELVADTLCVHGDGLVALRDDGAGLAPRLQGSLIHISEPTRPMTESRVRA
nr:LamB/YcsF family protein [Dyella sp. ASV21]